MQIFSKQLKPKNLPTVLKVGDMKVRLTFESGWFYVYAIGKKQRVERRPLGIEITNESVVKVKGKLVKRVALLQLFANGTESVDVELLHTDVPVED